MARPRPRAVLSAALAVLVLTSCGLAAEPGGSAESGGSVQSDESAGGSAAGYPVTVENCGAEVSFDAAPERLVLLKSSAVPFLAELGLLDRVSARAGEYPRAYYDDATWSALKDIPALTGRTDTSGHLLISKEVVISEEPDLVLGEVDNLSRETLSGVGIALMEEPAMCQEGLADPGFDDIHSQLATYGRIFDRAEEAAEAVAALEEREALVRVEPAGERRTAAVLYPTLGGGVTYAYGARSMADPLLEAAGLANVFGDTDERVFEVTAEELLGRNPDVLVLLHSAEGQERGVVDAVTSLPGAEDLTAVREEALLPLLFNYVEPPTPLALDGLALIAERFGSGS